MHDLIAVALRIGQALEEVGAAYFLGGSLASSMQGEPRMTNDLDFVVDLRAEQVAPLAEALGTDFDIDQESLLEAVRAQTSWNIYFRPTALKVDLFIRRPGAFDDAEFSRRQAIEIRPGQTLFLKSPEDTILRKLLWYRAGGEVSTSQWRDITQVLRVSGPSMDREYLDRWANDLNVAELLERARSASGGD